MEAAGLAVFMISACGFATLLEHPASPIRETLADPLLRRGLMGTAMGLTAVSIIYSPWGQPLGPEVWRHASARNHKTGGGHLEDNPANLVARSRTPSHPTASDS